jgi:hypothetical protein
MRSNESGLNPGLKNSQAPYQAKARQIFLAEVFLAEVFLAEVFLSGTSDLAAIDN